MCESKYKTELTADGYEKIEAKIQNLENIANQGCFDDVDPRALFMQIRGEAKQLRQILRDVLLIVPAPAAASASGGGEAA